MVARIHIAIFKLDCWLLIICLCLNVISSSWFLNILKLNMKSLGIKPKVGIMLVVLTNTGFGILYTCFLLSYILLWMSARSLLLYVLVYCSTFRLAQIRELNRQSVSNASCLSVQAIVLSRSCVRFLLFIYFFWCVLWCLSCAQSFIVCLINCDFLLYCFFKWHSTDVSCQKVTFEQGLHFSKGHNIILSLC